MILSIGDLLLDVFLFSELQQEEQQSGLLLRPGGSAANTAVWLSNMGHAVTFVGCVGADSIGRMLVQDLIDHNVITSIRTIAGAESGAVAILVSEAGERTMRSARGANAFLASEDVFSAGATRSSWVHLTGYALLCGSGLEILSAAGKMARRWGVPLSFDPSSVGVIHASGRDALLNAMVSAGVSVLLPNADECLALAGMSELMSAAGALLETVSTILVKNGERGAVACDSEVGYRQVPVSAVKAVDTTGAGDAFNAGAISELLRSWNVNNACTAGNASAASVLRSFGGRPTAGVMRGR